jgi:hypothetical protein
MSAFDNMPDGFVFAVCENCQIEGQFPASLICPGCGEKAIRYVAISAAELAALRAFVETFAGLEPKDENDFFPVSAKTVMRAREILKGGKS